MDEYLLTFAKIWWSLEQVLKSQWVLDIPHRQKSSGTPKRIFRFYASHLWGCIHKNEDFLVFGQYL